jgi:hypothetical protein
MDTRPDQARPRLTWATFLAPDMYEVYEAIAHFVGDRLGLASTLHVGGSFDEFALGQADFGFI